MKITFYRFASNNDEFQSDFCNFRCRVIAAGKFVDLIRSVTLFHRIQVVDVYLSFPPEANLHIEIGLSEVEKQR